MNTFIQDKLGEVLAFARIGKDTVEQGTEALLKILDDATITKIRQELDMLEEKIENFIEKEKVKNEVEEAAEETTEKVTSMRDTYIDGNWDEEDEVLEWMGFYNGASLVHWHLIMGAAEAEKLTDLKAIAKHALSFYNSLFSTDEKMLQKIGGDFSK